MSNKKAGPGDSWRTPRSVIEYVEKRWSDIGIDLCADESNSVCDTFFSEKNSMIEITGESYALEMLYRSDILWCNPPYSNPLPFVKKCIEISEMGQTVVMLLNQDTSTKWFMEIDKHAKGIHPITGGRIAFVDGDGNKIKGNNKPQLLVRLGGYGKQAWETIHISELQ